MTIAPMFPDDVGLRQGLKDAFGIEGPLRISRSANPYQGSFPSEIVEVASARSGRHRYFVKYGLKGKHTGHGYWGGVEREAWVYRYLLPPLALAEPRLVASHRDTATGETWLILEYLDGAQRLDKVPGKDVREALHAAVRWLAHFHAATEARGTEHLRDRLPTYDVSYFEGWVSRTADFSSPASEAHPWLAGTLARLEPLLASLTVGPMCVVHGEFYPGNVLIDRAKVRPVDWQSTAIGRGEIDLASLLEGWGDPNLEADLVREYLRVRWPGGAPADFEQVLGAARLYWPLRWLGDKPYWTLHPARRGWYLKLRGAAEALGLETASEGELL